jgi:hypothetical protein
VPTEIAEQRGLDVAMLAETAQRRLPAEADHHDAKALKVLGRRVLDVIAPEVAEEHERRLLEDEGRRAREHTRLTMSEDGHGLVHGRFTIPRPARRDVAQGAARHRRPQAPGRHERGECSRAGAG